MLNVNDKTSTNNSNLYRYVNPPPEKSLLSPPQRCFNQNPETSTIYTDIEFCKECENIYYVLDKKLNKTIQLRYPCDCELI